MIDNTDDEQESSRIEEVFTRYRLLGYRNVTRAHYWERGRLARCERAVRARMSDSGPFVCSVAPAGARCGRAARAPSEEVELFLAILSEPSTAEWPVARLRKQTRLHRIVFDVSNSVSKMLRVSNVPVEILLHPKLSGAAERLR